MRARNIVYVHAYAVDDCLVCVTDPIFVGFSISEQEDCTSKVVPKLTATEAIGVVAMKGDVFAVVEYSEITKQQAGRQDARKPDQLPSAPRTSSITSTRVPRARRRVRSHMALHISEKKDPLRRPLIVLCVL